MAKVLVLLLCLLQAFVALPAGFPIGLYDLRHTLTTDLSTQEGVHVAWDEVHTVSTLQGIVNRENPRLYVYFVKNGEIDVDTYWWNMYRRQGEWLHGRDTIFYHSLEELVTAYKDDIQGVVLYDSKVPSTSNVASAIAGIENLIAIRYDTSPGSVYDRLVAHGPRLKVRCWLVNPDGSRLFTGKKGSIIPQTTRESSGSLKADPYLWFIEKYMKTGKCNTRYGAYYIDQRWMDNPTAVVRNHHTLCNHDFFVSRKAFFFDLSPWGDEPVTDDPTQPVGTDLSVLKEFLLEAYKQNEGKEMCYIGGFPAWAFKYTKHAGGKHEDVPTEWEFSRLISAYNAFKDADAIGYGALANASFWQHFPLKKCYPQKWIDREELEKSGLLTKAGNINYAGRNFIIFYVGDYDASSWLSQRMIDLWNHPDRGKEPLMWCVSPVLSERVPHVMHYIRSTASDNDYFASADNGAGYLMPGMLQVPRPISGLPSGIGAWKRHCERYYKRWGLSVTGFVIDGEAPGLNKEGLNAYAAFSPHGIVPQKCLLFSIYEGMPVLRSDLDLVDNDPVAAANVLVKRVHERQNTIRFHWFRAILKSPEWYHRVMEEVRKQDPDIVLLDAPSFFELLRYASPHP